MPRKSLVMRLGPAVLAVGASLALAGCGRGSYSVPAGPSTGTESTRAACSAFAAAYKKFLAGYVPPPGQGGTRETPLLALADAVANISTSGQLSDDLYTLWMDAHLIAYAATQHGQGMPPSVFGGVLTPVGQDCGTTFTPPPASLL